MIKNLKFWKIEAAGNDFILIDNRDQTLSDRLPVISERICRRRFGIGADGAIFIKNRKGYDFEMEYFNADGSGFAMCGNGGRASILFARSAGICIKDNYHFYAADGEHLGRVRDNQIYLTINVTGSLKRATIESKEAFLVDSGAPHLVIITDSIDKIDIHKDAPPLRWKYNANIDYIEKIDTGLWRIRTYERGVEDETLACGTGAVASSLTISQICNEKYPLTIQAKGGNLIVDKTDDHIWLSGPTTKVFEGITEI